ncbi:MAG: exonuclease domain-containing protein, partial [Bacillota bacterium]|nr:exonuclease domain-containing protein [Bacillota bacterium]
MRNLRKVVYHPEIRELVIHVDSEGGTESFEALRKEAMKALPFLRQVEVHVDVENRDLIAAIREQSAKQGDANESVAQFRRRTRKTKLILKDEVICGGKIKGDPIEIEDLKVDQVQTFCAELTDFSIRELKGKTKALFSMSFSSMTAGVNAKLFFEEFEDAQQLEKTLSTGMMLLVEGRLKFDDYAKEEIVEVHKLNYAPKPEQRQDRAEHKRIELHAHTKMSEQDALMSAKQLVNRAISWGHEAVAITDHGSVQAFIEARDTAKGKIKILYGIEANLVNDIDPFFDPRLDAVSLMDSFVVFDIETTGFSAINEEIIELGCVKISGGSVVEEFSTLIKPSSPVSAETTELTGIDNAMLATAPGIESAFPKFMDFVGDLPLVAHNADFDTSFLRVFYPRFGREFHNPYINTIALARQLLDIKRYNLKAVSNNLGVVQTNRHRALADAMATAQVTLKFFQMLKERGCENFADANRYFYESWTPGNMEEYHAVVLVRNQDSLVDFYTDISSSYIEHFNQKPKTRKSDLAKHRAGYLISSSGEHGEVFQAALMRKSDAELDRLVSFYDYIELLPASAMSNLVQSGWAKNLDQIRDINRRILDSADRCGVTVVATSDAHFLDPEDEILRTILLDGKKNFDRMENPASMYLRTTEEMLEEFSYLGEERAQEIVVENTHRIAQLIGNVSPILEGTFPTTMEG